MSESRDQMKRRICASQLCWRAIPASRLICDLCLKRAHARGCPSPNQECSCGFSQLFWLDVESKYLAMPLCVDLYCGLGGWAEAFLAEGYRVVGFDIERHDYGTGGYPGQLVLQDARSLHGSQFRDAAVIVASPPCQKYSYMAMPWSRAKHLARWYEESEEHRRELTELFDTCFRIQREASEADGRHIPLIVENVRGAQRWVGRAKWHFGSYYLWGDVPALMPFTFTPKIGGARGDDWLAHHNTKEFEARASKVGGFSWSDFGDSDYKARGFNVTAAQLFREGVKQSGISGARANGRGDRWFQDGAARHGSKSNSRRAASAAIAKIPFPLAQHIARVFKPDVDARNGVECRVPQITAVNVSSTPLVTPAPMTAGPALNPFPGSMAFCRSCSEPLEDEAILAIHLAAGHEIGEAPLPDSGKKVTGSDGADGFLSALETKSSGGRNRTAECGRM